MVQDEPPGAARIARAIEPPISPKPMNPTCMASSIAATNGFGLSRRGRTSAAPASAGPTFGQPALAVRLGRTRVERRVLAPQVHPPLERPPIVTKVRPAPRATPFLREQRFERRDGVDLTTAGPAGELWHVAGALGQTLGRSASAASTRSRGYS
jgi:hypothetical protein